nr:LapA family protein [Desulfobulbaceae bacterium]
MNIKLIFILTLVGMAVLFVVQNVAIVEIQFFIWSLAVSRAILIFLVLAVGIIVGWLLHSYATHIENNKNEHVGLTDKPPKP